MHSNVAKYLLMKKTRELFSFDELKYADYAIDLSEAVRQDNLSFKEFFYSSIPHSLYVARVLKNLQLPSFLRTKN